MTRTGLTNLELLARCRFGAHLVQGGAYSDWKWSCCADKCSAGKH